MWNLISPPYLQMKKESLLLILFILFFLTLTISLWIDFITPILQMRKLWNVILPVITSWTVIESGLNPYLTLQFLTIVLYYQGNSFVPKSIKCWSLISQGKISTPPPASCELLQVIWPRELREYLFIRKMKMV